MATLSLNLVRFKDGKVNKDATLAAAGDAIDLYIVTRETETAEIAGHVSALFDQLNGARANMPYVVNKVLASMGATPANYNELSDRVGDFIRSSSGERGEATYHIGKGKGGGVTRWADQKPEEPTK
jgi:hypothetical protein